MGTALEVVNGFATNPGAALTGVTLLTGDTLAVRNFQSPARAYLETLWSAQATAGIVRVRSPRMHDNVQGYRVRTVPAAVRTLMPPEVAQLLYPQDTLTVELSGGAAESDGAAILNYYEDLPGAQARLMALAQLLPRAVNALTVEVAVGAGAAIGAYSAAAALNATFDLLEANTDYAVIGYEVDATGLSVGIRGPDTANLRVGGPMTTERLVTNRWFADLEARTGRPHIPVLNSANKGATLIDTAQVVAGVAANVNLNLLQLRP